MEQATNVTPDLTLYLFFAYWATATPEYTALLGELEPELKDRVQVQSLWIGDDDDDEFALSVQTASQLGRTFDVRTLPCFVLACGSELLWKHSGPPDRELIMHAVQEHLL